jgi:hypothetical protein
MKIDEKKIHLQPEDLQELFSLFTSVTQHEKEQLYDCSSPHYFRHTDLSAEYELSEEKGEYALDAWRAVLSFLHAKGFTLIYGEHRIDLAWVAEEFIGAR